MSEVAPAAPAPSAPPAAAPAVAPAEGEALAQNTADQAPAPAPEGESPETPEQAAKREGRRFGRKLDKAYRERAEAQARADFLEKQLNELKPKAPVDSEAPRLEQFKDIEEYAEAKAKYQSDKALKAHTTEQNSKAQKQHEEKLAEEWEAKAARADGKYEDFDEVVGELKPTHPWAQAIMEAENAEDVAYYLGKNLKEARRIMALPPVSQIREIGKIEAKLLAEPPKAQTPSKAPAPITPLKGAAPVASDVPSEQDSTRDWMRKRQKQVHGKRT